MYNASYYYKEGEDWNNAIRVNNQYIATYPQNPIAIDLFFANAGHYLKLDNLTEANRIFEEFANKYPDDPRGVQSFYERGAYYQRNGNLSAAKTEYNKAIQKSEQLSAKGLDPNRYYVGEALNSLVGMLEELPDDCDHEFSTDEGFTAVVFPPAMDNHSDEEEAIIDAVIDELSKGIEIMAYCVRAEEFEDCEPGKEDETVPDCVVEKIVHEEVFFSVNMLAGEDGAWRIRAWSDMTTESGLAH